MRHETFAGCEAQKVPAPEDIRQAFTRLIVVLNTGRRSVLATWRLPSYKQTPLRCSSVSAVKRPIALSTGVLGTGRSYCLPGL